MADYSSSASLSLSPGYDTDSIAPTDSASTHSVSDRLDDTDDDQSGIRLLEHGYEFYNPSSGASRDIRDSDGESDGGLFVPERQTLSPASAVTLSSSDSARPHHQGQHIAASPDTGIDDIDIDLESELERALAADAGASEPGSDEESDENSDDYEDEHDPIPEGYPPPFHDDFLDFFGDPLFGDDFDDTDEEDLEDDIDDFDLPEPRHHHHHHHHLFHPPRLPAVHPELALGVGVNPLQPLGPRLNFLTPNLHDQLHRAHSSSPFIPNQGNRMEPAHRSRIGGTAPHRDELIGVELRRRENPSGSGTNRSLRGQSQQISQPPRQTEFVDLTGDDDDEIEIVGGSQNVRRQQSGHRDNRPGLNRSDSSYIGNSGADIIVIDSDSEESPAAGNNRPNVSLRESPRRQAPRHHHHHVHHHHVHRPPMEGRRSLSRGVSRGAGAHSAHGGHSHHGHHGSPGLNLHPNLPNNRNGFLARNINNILNSAIGGLGNFVRGGREADQDLMMLGAGPAFNQGAVPLPGIQQINLDYLAHPFPNLPNHASPAGPPKPPHQPPPKAREGFTRDTGEEQVVICPSCEEELAYDPDDFDDIGPPSKKPRTKKDKAEHHFWAVKDCGHVFCRRCYENRRPTARSPFQVGFRPALDNPKKTLCAVEGCNSDVSSKTAWVGIFL